MKKRFLPLALTAMSASATQSETPNFLVVLLDDVGYADFSCFGGIIPTPNIDSLAAHGIRMSQMYNCSRSCPTRASLLTGLYPQQAGIGYMTGANQSPTGNPAYQGYLNKNCLTIAQVLKENDYFTAMTGKWHLTYNAGSRPVERGFDRSLNAQAGGYYFKGEDGFNMEENGKSLPANHPVLTTAWYSTDLWTDYALKYIDESIAEDKPFFMYLAYNAAHFPLQAPADEIAHFKGDFSEGWDVLRQRVYENQKALNLFGASYELTPKNPLIPNWDELSETQRKQSEHQMEIYAATIKKVDDNIGKLVRELKEKGVYDNTLIWLMSDNGGNAEGGSVFGNYKGTNPGGVNSSVFYGQAWAEVSNTPFFLYKHHTHEGGIAAPCVISYPNGIPSSQNGQIIDEPSHVIDIMATLVSMSGTTYPSQYNGKTIKPMQGVDMSPAWRGEQIVRPEPIFWEHEGNVAMRKGDWKLVKEFNQDAYSLFNITNDRTELNDCSESATAIYDELLSEFADLFEQKEAEIIDFGKDLRWYVSPDDYLSYWDDIANTDTILIETFGANGTPITEYKYNPGVQLESYADYSSVANFVATNTKATVVIPPDPSNLKSSSGKSALMFGASSASTQVVISNISTQGYDKIQLSFSALKPLGSNSNIKIEYAVEDGLWSEVEGSSVVQANAGWQSLVVSQKLPMSASLSLRIGISSQYTLFDDILITGIKNNENDLPMQTKPKYQVLFTPDGNSLWVDSSDIIQMQLYAMHGVLLSQSEGNSLNTSHLASGYYVLRFYDGSKYYSQKLIRTSSWD